MYDFERDGAVMSFVAGEVYGGHPAAPKLPLDGVPTGERCPQFGRRLVRGADMGVVDMRQQWCGEDWRGLHEKPCRGIRLLAAAQQLIDLRPQVLVGASSIQEIGAF